MFAGERRHCVHQIDSVVTEFSWLVPVRPAGGVIDSLKLKQLLGSDKTGPGRLYCTAESSELEVLILIHDEKLFPHFGRLTVSSFTAGR